MPYLQSKITIKEVPNNIQKNQKEIILKLF